ncbi:hypothetical protein BC831DRAFT_6220 [Entophlyctis helioformis]|nr:hypothetical protein BC831DRAFT_6220 [Entophlyctis helioformis]
MAIGSPYTPRPPETFASHQAKITHSWKEICTTIDSDMLRSRLNLISSLDASIESLTADQRDNIVTSLDGASATTMRDAAPKTWSPLPQPASSYLTAIQRKLLPNTTTKHRERRPLTEEEAQTQKEEITRLLEIGRHRYAVHQCSAYLAPLLQHPDVQQWSVKQLILTYASFVYRVATSISHVKAQQPHLFVATGLTTSASAGELSPVTASCMWTHGCCACMLVLADTMAWQMMVSYHGQTPWILATMRRKKARTEPDRGCWALTQSWTMSTTLAAA